MQLTHCLELLVVIGFCSLSEFASAIPVLVPRDSVELVITPEDIRSAANYAMRKIPEVKEDLKSSLKTKFFSKPQTTEPSSYSTAKPKKKVNKKNQPKLEDDCDDGDDEDAEDDEDDSESDGDDDAETEFVGYYKPKDLKSHNKDLGIKYTESAYDSFYDEDSS